MRWRSVVTGLALLAVPGTCQQGPARALETSVTTKPTTTTPIKHFITLMQQNHSFDNYFGSRPGVDGLPPKTCLPMGTGQDGGADCVAPFHVGGRPIVDLGDSIELFDAQMAGGRLDGFVTALAGRTEDPGLTMGYYDDSDLPFYWNVADEYVLFDHFFSSAFSGTLRNHLYWVAGAPDVGLDGQPLPGGVDGLPTIFDRLQQAGVSWKFYVDEPTQSASSGGQGAAAAAMPLLQFSRFLGVPLLANRIVPVKELFTDIEKGTLPSVAYVVASHADEHPPARADLGERFVRQVVTALMRSTSWPSSAFAWTYDGWGGWYDHVPPPHVDAFGYGFRVPALLVSPYARRGHVDSTQLDSTSFLKFIEENWGVPPLASRDEAANSITSAFDFKSPPRAPVLLDRARSHELASPERRSVVFIAYGLVVAGIAAAGMAAWQRGRRTRRVLRGLP